VPKKKWPCLVGWNLAKILLPFQLSPSHHIKYIKRHMFRAVNVGKKLTNHTVLLYITSRIFWV
jgi:hypothetical protein